MAKKIQTTIKLQLPAGKATPAPPVGTALGPHGLNIMDFCKQFNAKTGKEPDGMIFPVLVTVYTDRTFTFILKTPPASVLTDWLSTIAAEGLLCRPSACLSRVRRTSRMRAHVPSSRHWRNGWPDL